MNREERIQLARAYHSTGAIIQGSWRRGGGDNGGRELVCALAAFGKDINDSGDCPADLMPQWLAALVPAIDDGIAADQVPWFFGELIDHAARWHILDDTAWERIRTGFMIAGIKQAVESASKVHQQAEPPAYWSQVVSACEQVCTALQSGGDLEKAKAWSAAESAARSAESAARSAESAARSAARSAAWKSLAETLFAIIDAEIRSAGQ